MLMEEKDLSTVLKEGKQGHIGFHPTKPLSALHFIFSALKLQTSGNYLLHHDSKTGAFIHLMKEVNENER